MTHCIYIKGCIKSECKTLITKKIIVGNLMYLIWNLTSSKNIDKDIENLSNIIKKLNLIYLYRMFFLKSCKYTFLFIHGTYIQISHVLDHNENLVF